MAVAIAFQVAPSFMMLAGLCMENLAKCEMTYLGKVAIENGKLKFPANCKHHDLVRLFGIAEIALEEAEQDFLRRATLFVKWAGRYHLPLRCEEALAPDDTVRNSDFDVFSRLFDRIYLAHSEKLFERVTTELGIKLP